MGTSTEPHAAQREWGVVAVTSQLLVRANSCEAAVEFAEGRLHLTVVSRTPGNYWEPVHEHDLPVELDDLSDEELAALQFEAARLLAQRQGRQL